MYIFNFALQLQWNTEFDPYTSYLQRTTVQDFRKANPAMESATSKCSAGKRMLESSMLHHVWKDFLMQWRRLWVILKFFFNQRRTTPQKKTTTLLVWVLYMVKFFFLFFLEYAQGCVSYTHRRVDKTPIHSFTEDCTHHPPNLTNWLLPTDPPRQLREKLQHIPTK